VPFKFPGPPILPARSASPRPEPPLLEPPLLELLLEPPSLEQLPEPPPLELLLELLPLTEPPLEELLPELPPQPARTTTPMTRKQDAKRYAMPDREVLFVPSWHPGCNSRPQGGIEERFINDLTFD
jgi:hypothetical protein